MKRFHFRLERVLHYLHQQEMLQSMEVAKSERVRAAAASERDVARARKADADDRIVREHEALSSEDLEHLYAHGEFLHREIALLDARLSAAQAELDERRELLLTMSKKRKVVEELRERRKAGHEDEVRRLEIAGVDEMNERRRPLSAPVHEERS